MSPRVARFILGIFGWKVEGELPASMRKYIIIVAPHTSWWDFPVGLLARAAIGRHIYFLGKASLFNPPFGGLMRWLGGVPVDRTKRNNAVEQVIELYDAHEDFAIALAPEGTRRKVSEFKTGFYYIAKGAGIPIICVQFDYKHRCVLYGKPFYTSNDAEEDLRKLWSYFAGVEGKRAEQGISG
jgi:1-acyl-sn-glycerol-3-phosphate acyltransferase